MAKPDSVLMDMPVHIKEKIIINLSLFDRCSLKSSAKEWQQLVPRCKEAKFDKIFLFVNFEFLELMIKQKDENTSLKFSETYNSVYFHKWKRGKTSSGSMTPLQKITEVYDEILKSIFTTENLTIDQLIVADLTAGSYMHSFSFRQYFTIALERVLTNRRQLMKVGNIGIATSENNSDRFKFILKNIDLKHLVCLNLQVLEMSKYGERLYTILESDAEPEDLEFFDEETVRVCRHLRTMLTGGDFWRFFIPNKLVGNFKYSHLVDWLRELESEHEKIPQDVGHRMLYQFSYCPGQQYRYQLRITPMKGTYTSNFSFL